MSQHYFCACCSSRALLPVGECFQSVIPLIIILLSVGFANAIQIEQYNACLSSLYDSHLRLVTSLKQKTICTTEFFLFLHRVVTKNMFLGHLGSHKIVKSWSGILAFPDSVFH